MFFEEEFEFGIYKIRIEKGKIIGLVLLLILGNF